MHKNAPAQATETSRPTPTLHKPVEVTLSNGMPVVLQHSDGPVAATYWWIKAGSADEGKGEEGFAHFLEHMLFKDAAAKETGRASTGQMAQAIESLGGDINAYTSFDQTVYHVTCAAHHWERVIDSFGAMAKPQRFLKSDFDREREVILEELRKNEDSPGRQLFQGLFTATFTKHPYGRPVIGFVRTLKAARVATLEAFYKRCYVSGNMGLVLVGPIDDGTGKRREQILKLLEKHYGSRVIPKRETARRARPVETQLREKPVFLKKPFDVKTPTLALGFRVPELRHPDVAALDLMTSVLAMGELSRLYQQLFYKTSIATEVSGGLYVPNDPGMLYFQAEVEKKEQILPAAEQLLAELARLRNEGPTAEELERVLVNAESERLYATQTADGQAGRLGFLRFILGDLNYDRDYLDELRSVDAKRIQAVAAEYLDFSRLSGALLIPNEDKGYDIEPILARAKELLGAKSPAEAKASAKKKAPVAKLERLPELITRPSGIRVIHRERGESHVMSVHAAALGGLRLELAQPVESRDADWGSSYMMSLTWTKGTAQRGSRDIAALVEGSAASMDGFSGRNTVGLQLTGLARDWDKLSGLFNEVLVEPEFPENEVEHSRRVAEDSVRGIEDHSAQLCTKLFLETLFENHPYGRLTTGSLESLGAMKGEKLRAFHRRWVRPERLVLSVAGAVSRGALDRWLDQLEERFGRMPAGAKAAVAADPAIVDEPALKGPRWVERKLGREQTHILVGGLGAKIGDPERYALRLLQTLLGGQSGRLFIELREKKSLAYTVAPVSFEGVERGYIGTYIACSPQKREEAVSGIKAVLEKLAKKGPTPAEMKRAKQFYLGRRAMDLQSDSALAAHYGLEEIYRLPIQSQDEIIRKVEAVTAKQVQDVCRRYLVDQHMVTSIVG